MSNIITSGAKGLWRTFKAKEPEEIGTTERQVNELMCREISSKPIQRPSIAIKRPQVYMLLLLLNKLANSTELDLTRLRQRSSEDATLQLGDLYGKNAIESKNVHSLLSMFGQGFSQGGHFVVGPILNRFPRLASALIGTPSGPRADDKRFERIKDRCSTFGQMITGFTGMHKSHIEMHTQRIGVVLQHTRSKGESASSQRQQLIQGRRELSDSVSQILQSLRQISDRM